MRSCIRPPLTDGLLLVSVLVGWSYLLNWLGFQFPFLQRLVKPPKLPLVIHGRMIRKNMKKELIPEDELLSEIRSQGIKDLQEVEEAFLEPDGRISVIANRQEPHPAEKHKGV